jgi:hypothetical protein
MAASVTIEDNVLRINLPGWDEVWSFHGSMQIPFEHVTNAYVSTRRDLHLRWRLLGTGAGPLKTAGTFTDDHGMLFCDLSGSADDDCLVIETKDEPFARIALTLPGGVNPNDVAHQVCAAAQI